VTIPGLAIETVGLTKRFGSHLAVNDVNLSVPQGSVFGFLGPNGSGKTTTIRMLLGLITATSGSARVLGNDMPAGLGTVLPRVGALVEGPGFYPYLSGAANLHRLDTADRHVSAKTRSRRVDDALERVGLSNAATKKVHAYSLGMKQRLGLANALLAPRDLLVLDEPTNGLDPQGTREVRSLVRSLAAEGATIFVSSHLLAEIEQMCTHAAIMSAGRLVAQGTLDELRQVGEPRVRVVTPDTALTMRVLTSLGLAASVPPADAISIDGTTIFGAFAPTQTEIEPDAVVAALVAEGVRVRGFAVERPSLEDRFVALTGEGFDVAE
jgi:ABC-2 type transport system ATP-binding protein